MTGPDRPAAPPAPSVLHAIANFRWTGAAEPVLQLAAMERRLGGGSVLAMPPGGGFEEKARVAGVPAMPDLLTRHAGPVRLWRVSRELRRRAAKFDLLHCHLSADHWLGCVALSRWKSGEGRPPLLVRTWHREELPRVDPINRLVARSTDGAIAVSQSLAIRLRDAYGFPPERVFVSGGWVDAEEFRPGGDGARLRALWGIPPDAPVAGMLGRVRESRGQFALLNAVEPLLALLPEARIVFCGRGRHAKRLRAAIAKHPRRDQIHFPGYVSPTELNDAYAAFDVAVQLAPGNDGTCRAALQSMACGRPLVAGRVGSLADLLAPLAEGAADPAKRGGVSVPPNDPQALAEALALLLGDRDLARRSGERARARMLAERRPDAEAGAIVDFYRLLLAMPPRRSDPKGADVGAKP